MTRRKKVEGRSLEILQQKYHATVERAAHRGPGGGRGPGMRGIGGGKPKNARQTIGRLLKYVGKYRVFLILVVFCMLINTLTSLVGGYMLSPIINRVAGVDPSELTGMSAVADRVIESYSRLPFVQSVMNGSRLGEVAMYLAAALFLLGMIYCVGIVTNYLQARLMLVVSQSAVKQIRDDLFTKMQSIPIRFFDTTATGEVMSRYTNDIDNVDMMLHNSLVSFFSGIISLIGTFVFMLSTSWILTLVTIAFIPVFLFGGGAIGKKSSKYYKSQQAALGAINGYIEESVAGQKVIKVFNHEEVCEDEFEKLNRDMRDKQFKAMFYGGIMGPVMGNMGQVSYAVTVGVGGLLILGGSFTPGALTVFANYSRQFSMPINMISQQMTTIFAALAGAERVFAVMDMPPETPDEADAIGEYPLTEKSPVMRGDVVFEDVTFGYNPDKTILKNISLYAHPGQKIAFVGSTGAGKTTVTNLINRFYDIEAGKITIDGVELTRYRRDYLRANVAMVLQDTHLFTGTVMENIRYGRLDATDEEVIAAAKTVSAHSFITRLSDGYQTVLTGDGANLSQGQRQLLNIARAALSKAPILVLDEATSSVDTRTERLIEQGMDNLMKNRTTFVIAHRLSTIRNANAIMVLEKGEIIERGTHEDLLALGGRYYELYTGAKELD